MCCDYVWMRVTVLLSWLFHSFTQQVRYEVRIADSELDQYGVKYIFSVSVKPESIADNTERATHTSLCSPAY